eukprot:1715678-Prymnesium_polylepis.1
MGIRSLAYGRPLRARERQTAQRPLSWWRRRWSPPSRGRRARGIDKSATWWPARAPVDRRRCHE